MMTQGLVGTHNDTIGSYISTNTNSQKNVDRNSTKISFHFSQNGSHQENNGVRMCNSCTHWVISYVILTMKETRMEVSEKWSIHFFLEMHIFIIDLWTKTLNSVFSSLTISNWMNPGHIIVVISWFQVIYYICLYALTLESYFYVTDI